MKNRIVLTLLLVTAFVICNAQTSYLGLAASKYNYLYPGGVSNNKGPVYIVYNQYYCVIQLGPDQRISFPVTDLTKDKNGTESFLNDDGPTALRGYWTIRITRNKKDGNSVMINAPQAGIAYLFTNAHVYSPDGEVKGFIEQKTAKK